MLAGSALSAAVAAVVVLRHIGTKPLWRDEAISLSVAGRPVLRILAVLPRHDANAGLYYLLLHAWLPVGRSAASARSLSAACFIATAALAAWAASRWRGWEIGLACGLLVAVNPFLVYYGQEARPYALAVLLATASTVALFWRRRGPAPGAYLVATIALLYADLFAILFVGALAVVMVAWYRVHGDVVPPVLKRCWWIIAAAAAPLAVVMTIFERGQISWLPRPTFMVLVTTVTSMSSGWLGLEVVVVLATLALLARSRTGGDDNDRMIVAALAAAFVVPPVALWAVSQVVPSFVDRYVICSTLAMIALAGSGLWVLRGRAGRTAAVAVLAGLLVLGGQQTARMEAEPYKVDNAPAVVAYIEHRAEPGDAVAYAGGGLRILIESWLTRPGGRPATTPFPADVALAPRGEAFLQDDLYAREVGAAVLVSRLAAVDRLWLITDPGDQRYPQGGPFAESKALVMATFDFGATTSFGAIDLTLLVRHP